MAERSAIPPDVSVIVTSYNVERYIARAITSALDQEGVVVEVIVVDDGSSDATWEIIASIRDPRLRHLRLEANQGPGAARNAGISLSCGEWIAVLDGDDAFLPGRLARLVAKAKRMDADIAVDNLRVEREADGASFPMFPQFSGLSTLDLAAFISGNRAFLGGYTLGYLKPVFSAEFLRRHAIAYDPGLRIGEDYIFLADALACGARCIVEPQEGYVYTVRAGSISHRLSPADVTRMLEGDKQFMLRHRLEPAAMSAQRRRENSLKEAYAFTVMVDMIKQRNLRGMIGAFISCPQAARHLWEPVRVRIRRLSGRDGNQGI